MGDRHVGLLYKPRSEKRKKKKKKISQIKEERIRVVPKTRKIILVVDFQRRPSEGWRGRPNRPKNEI